MATALTRWDPAADFAAMRNVMDRLFEQPFTRLPFRTGEDLGNPTLSLDVIENGDTFVIKAGPKFEVLATNSVAEPVWASLALARGMVFIRGEKHLFGIR